MMQVETEKQTNKTALIAGMVIFVALFIGCLVIPKGVAQLINQPISSEQSFFITRLLFWVCIGLLYLYTAKVERLPLLLWPEQTFNFTTSLKWIVILLIVVFLGSACINMTIKFLGLGGMSLSSNAAKAMLQMGIPLRLFTVLTAAVTEEILFRGYLIPRLQLFFKNAYLPAIISSVIFGFAHFRYGTIVNIVAPIYIGLIFSFYYHKFRNLKVLIIVHFIIDFIAFRE